MAVEPRSPRFRRTLVIAGIIAIAILIWTIGSLIAVAGHPILASRTARFVCIALVVTAAIVRFKLHAWRKARADRNLAEGLATAEPAGAHRGSAAPAPDDEAAIIGSRFATALATARRRAAGGGWLSALAGRRHLHELPWYLLIGAAGSGKTTALLHAGLTLHADGQDAVVAGIGGTRHCDWLFADEAVLIDTAGRYTTQDATPERDQRGWTGFLDLLKRHRPRSPLNGVLLAIGTDTLLQSTDDERVALARSLRARLHELHERLGTRFPIYVLVTKTDLLAGFDEFFGPLPKSDRDQVWGMTLPLATEGSGTLPEGLTLRFAAEFERLGRRLDERLIERLQEEPDLARRSTLFGFPQQWAALRDPLQGLVGEVFRSASLEAPPILRGVYFTSATQAGARIDRVLGELGRSMGLPRTAEAAPVRGESRSLFLPRLMKDVVIAERHLAGTDLRREYRRLASRLALLAAGAVLAVVAGVAWLASYRENLAFVRDVDARVVQAQPQLAALGTATDGDVVALVPALDAVRDVARPGTRTVGFGLQQADKLGDASDAAYRSLLRDAFVPRLARRIEQALAGPPTDAPHVVRDTLKAYLMLHDAARFDPEWFSAYAMGALADWAPRDVTQDARQAFARHLAEAARTGPIASPFPLDTALVGRVRETLRRVPLERRIVDRIGRMEASLTVPEFTLVRAGGASVHSTLRRASGRPIERGIPGYYTRDGYWKAFEPSLEPVARRMLEEESWVLGDPAARGSAAELETLLRETRRAYLEDYQRTWRALIDDIRIVRPEGIDGSVRLLRALSTPNASPLPPLLRAIVREVTLASSEAERKSLVERGRAALQRGREEVERLVGTVAAGDEGRANAAEAMATSLVDARFEDLRRLTTSPSNGGAAPIDELLRSLDDLHGLVIAQQAALRNGMPPPPSELGRRVGAESARLPEPLAGMVSQLARDATRDIHDRTIAVAGESVRAELSDLCSRAIDGRYPFVRTAAPGNDATHEDFAALFAPGGRFDEVFRKTLAPLVDTTSVPWRIRPGDTALPRTSAALPEFQRAASIRDAFFRHGGRTPQIRLELRPLEMDASIHQFTLDVDGQLVRYAHGPQVPHQIQWPGNGPRRQVRITMQPPAATGVSGLTVDGQWALFRLFDQMAIEPTQRPERFVVTFAIDGRRARFEVVASTVMNPFRLRELAEFRCPRGL